MKVSHVKGCISFLTRFTNGRGGGRVVRRCWVNFQCWCVLLFWTIEGQGPVVVAVDAGGGCLDIFFSHLSRLFFFLPPSGRRPDID